MGLLDRALNIGESKQFREYEKRVAIIGGFEPELELESDEELRERFGGLRERARQGESLDDLLPETFAIVRLPTSRTTANVSGSRSSSDSPLRARSRRLAKRSRSSSSDSSSSSGSKPAMMATRFSYSRNCLDSPMFSARSRRPMR